jgi:hypothetical protein
MSVTPCREVGGVPEISGVVRGNTHLLMHTCGVCFSKTIDTRVASHVQKKALWDITITSNWYCLAFSLTREVGPMPMAWKKRRIGVIREKHNHNPPGISSAYDSLPN